MFSPSMIPSTIQHNMTIFNHLRTDFFMNRIKYLYGPISAIGTVNKKSKILLIGSRTENEILYLKGYDYDNIKAIDLIAYSPLIEIQDMHNLNFQDNCFDLVIMGWTLAYSTNPQKCASEIIRVLNNNGIVAIGQQASSSNLNGINTIKDIHFLFESYINKIYFQIEGENQNLSQEGVEKISEFSSSHQITVFSIKKNSNEINF